MVDVWFQGRSALWTHLQKFKAAEEAALAAHPPQADDGSSEGSAYGRVPHRPPSGYLTVSHPGHRPRAAQATMGMGPGHVGTLPRRSRLTSPAGRAQSGLTQSADSPLRGAAAGSR